MQISVEELNEQRGAQTRIGNVYSIKGGRGLRYGHMMVLLAITEPKDRYDSSMALMLVIDKEGNPRGVTSYNIHYIEEQMPIAFCEGVEEIRLTVKSL